MRRAIVRVGRLVGAGVVLAAALAGGQGTAWAEPTGFGRQGVMGISWDQPLVAGTILATNTSLSVAQPGPMALTPIGFQYYSVNNNGGSGTTFSLAPAIDYFVIDNLSIGGQLMFGLVSSSPPTGQGTSTTLYGVAPQVGYDLVLTDSISFWPKVFFAFTGASTSNNGGSFSSGTLGVFAPFLFHIATHFYIGVGPDLSTQVVTSQSSSGPPGGNAPNPPKVTTFGAMATVGGWFNLGGG